MFFFCKFRCSLASMYLKDHRDRHEPAQKHQNPRWCNSYPGWPGFDATLKRCLNFAELFPRIFQFLEISLHWLQLNASIDANAMAETNMKKIRYKSRLRFGGSG